MIPFQSGQIVELKIDRLSYDGGRGVGRHDGFVIFVPFTAPEDLVEVQITDVKKNYAFAKLIRVIVPSPYRTKPECEKFGICGGCVWQHVNYDKQIEEKRSFLQRILKETAADFKQEIVPQIEMFASPKPYRYRNRIQVRTLNKSVGYFSFGTHDFVPLEDCPIADETLVATWPNLPHRDDNTPLKVEIHKVGENVKIRRLDEEESQFSQINPDINKVLVEAVRQEVLKSGAEVVYDLFCGDGNITFAIQNEKLKQTVGVESSKSAIDRATEYAEAKGLRNISFHSKNVDVFLAKLKNDASESLMIVDPPRAGLDKKLCDLLLQKRPKSIVYVSCHLATLKRDLKYLAKSYKLDRFCGFDMFPQTEYVEALCVLRRTI